jgi:hypothetical protein
MGSWALLAGDAVCSTACAVLGKEQLTEGQKLAAVAVVMTLLVLAAVALVKMITANASFRCQFCNAFVTALRDTPDTYRDEVIASIRECSRRDPDPEAIYVCLKCRTVYDDVYSDEVAANGDFNAYSDICKSCGTVTHREDPNQRKITCARCGATYSWVTDEATGFRFLLREADALPP